MNVANDQRVRALVAIDGRQYPRKTASYIDVMGLSSVSEAVHEAARMLRLGIEYAMAQGVEGDQPASENPDRQKAQKAQNEVSAPRTSQPASREPVSVYSTLSKRPRRPVPPPTEVPQQQQSTKPPDDNSTSTQRPGFAPRSWSATKKAGPSILSKRKRSTEVTGKPGDKTGTLPAFQPTPKREKLSDVSTKNSAANSVSKAVEKKPATAQFAPVSSREAVSPGAIKADIIVAKTSKKAVDSSASNARTSGSSSSKPPTSSWMKLQSVPSSSATRSTARKLNEFSKVQPTSLSPTTRKVGLPPSWCQVSTRSFRKDSGVKQPSAISLLRRSGPSKPRELPAAPRGSLGLSMVPKLKQAAPRLVQTTLRTPSTENGGLIPLPSSTGVKVKYVPGSEIIDGVRPNGYTVSIDGVVKPVVTFNPKPKLPHKLRQTSVEKLFEAWRDNAKVVEGDALARALRTEQEMYAKAKTRTDYRGAVTTKLKELRSTES